MSHSNNAIESYNSNNSSNSPSGFLNKSSEVSPVNYNSYSDPLGPPQDRPRTGMRKNLTIDDDSDDDINPYDLLPV